jgi:hypothetical protein
MIELKVYAAGLRDLDKKDALDHQLEPVPGLRYKVDSNHDIVYLKLDPPTITSHENGAIFAPLALEPRLKTELLSA